MSPYRPQTRGKVEVVAKLVDRLQVYNEEFDVFEEICALVIKFNKDINNEPIADFWETPSQRLEKEKEYLSSIPPYEALSDYIGKCKEYKVSKESMVTYKGQKYSVSLRLLGKKVTIEETETELQIYYTTDLVVSHKISDNRLNYKRAHVKEILKSDSMRERTGEEIEKFIEEKLSKMDMLLEGDYE